MGADETHRDDPLVAAYLELAPVLVRFFTARTGSASEAEDVVQDIYLKINGREHSDIENPRAYLFRVGDNVLLDRRRSRLRAQSRDDAYERSTATIMGTEVVEDAPSMEDVADSRQRLARLMEALEGLPPQCRKVFTMHKLDGLSYAETASRLGVSRSAVEKHMMSALRKLADLDLR